MSRASKDTIRNLEIGSIKAEVDKFLLDTYVPGEWITEITTKNKVFVIGRTGSGKSALLRYLENKHDKTRVAKILPDEFALEALVSSVSEFADQELPEILLKCMWLHCLTVEVLKKCHGSKFGSKWKLLIGTHKKAYDYLESTEELSFEDLTFTDRLLRTIQRFKLNMSIKGISFGSEGTSKEASSQYAKYYSSFKELQRLAESIEEHTKGAPYLVLVDELDQFADGSKSSKRVLRALLEVIIEQHRRNKTIHYVVALRADIFSQLDFPQRESLEDYKVYTRWTRDQLKTIVSNRVALVHGINSSDVWGRFFPPSMGKYETFDFMYERTFGRPRDLIVFTNICISKAAERSRKTILSSDVEDAEAVYSRGRLSALIDEWKFVYPNLDYLLNKFKNAPLPLGEHLNSICLEAYCETEAAINNPSFPKWILSYSNSKDIDFYGIAKILLLIGFLVLYRKQRAYELITEEKSIPTKLSFEMLSVHPAFHSSLDIARNE